MTLNELVSEYLQYCKNNKRLSGHTMKAYMTDLKQFCNHFSNTDIDSISAQSIENYISALHGGFKPKTVKRKVASFKAFYHYLEYKDILCLNPFSQINTKFREPINLPKIIPLSSVEAILKSAYAEKKSGSEGKTHYVTSHCSSYSLQRGYAYQNYVTYLLTRLTCLIIQY